MRLQILSDLHLEWREDGGEDVLNALDPTGVDALILAGDVVALSHGGGRGEAEAQLRVICERYPRVYYVPGNHEYYGTSPALAHLRLQAMAAVLPNLVVLDAGRIDDYMGVRVLGGTLWFSHTPGNERYYEWFTDFVLIDEFVPWVYGQSATFRAFLKANLRPGDVVVSHHLPSWRSVHPRYTDSPLNRFFLCDVEPLIKARQPALWVHGHTHEPADYFIGRTQVACNPLGYPGETGSAFRWQWIVTVEPHVLEPE